VNNYECVVIFDGLLSEEETKVQQERVQEVITKNGGEVTRVDVWGKRHLTYEIKKRREGFYIVVYFNTTKKIVLQELDRFCRIDEKVIRHMICHEIKSKTAPVSPEAKLEEKPADSEKSDQIQQPAVQEDQSAETNTAGESSPADTAAPDMTSAEIPAESGPAGA
jgi:small subunit ribosomal protein S6